MMNTEPEILLMMAFPILLIGIAIGLFWERLSTQKSRQAPTSHQSSSLPQALVTDNSVLNGRYLRVFLPARLILNCRRRNTCEP